MDASVPHGLTTCARAAALCLLLVSPGGAQDAPAVEDSGKHAARGDAKTEPPSVARIHAASDHPDPAPQGALGWWWEHSTAIPVVFYAPENQLGLGAGFLTTFKLKDSDPKRPSSVSLIGVYTTRRQTIVNAGHEWHFAHDRHVLWQEARYIDWPDRFYGFGNDTREADRENYTDNYFQLETEYQARPYHKLYVGARSLVRYSRTLDMQANGRLLAERPLGVGAVLFSGLGGIVLFDDRDALFWPTRGQLLRADATLFAPFLGSDFTGLLVRVDLRRYLTPWLNHVLALRLVNFAAAGDLPFQLLPALGGSLLFRGWFLGRLRDNVMLALEGEYRWPIRERWALVAFGSTGRVAPRYDELAFRGFKATGGGGLRFALRTPERANLRLDIAHGDELSVYFQFKEAF